MDGIYLRRNWGREFENVVILVAIAVNEDGYREVLGAAESMKEDKTITFKVLDDIPIGHKIALKDLNVGDTVFKYGTDIGKVVKPIRQGEHLHVHNVKTKRW